MQGAIMAVGASEPAVVATKDGRIGLKNQMQVTNSFVMMLLKWSFLDSKLMQRYLLCKLAIYTGKCHS